MAKDSGVVFRIKAQDETKQGTESAKSSFQSFVGDVDQLFNGKLSQLGKVVSSPWVLATTAISGTAKIFKELTSIGLEAQQGFEQLRASFGDYAMEVDGMLDVVDRTTLATKDDLEGMAKALSQYGYSVEELQGILQVTADISTVTSKEFSAVQSAVISALQGQSRAIEKLIPDWDSLVTEYGSVEGALQHLGGEYEQTRLKFTDGSISQTLDNMSSSWKNIKDNLGQTMVLRIQQSGVLDTVCDLLQRIEANTGYYLDREKVADKGTSAPFRGDVIEQLMYLQQQSSSNNVQSVGDWFNTLSREDRNTLFGTNRSWLKDLVGITDEEDARNLVLSHVLQGQEGNPLLDALNLEETITDIVSTLMERYGEETRAYWSDAELDILITDVQSSIREMVKNGVDTTAKQYELDFLKGVRSMEVPQAPNSGAKVESYLNESITTAEILTKCAYGKFGEVTEGDWNHIFSTIALSDELWDAYADTAFEYYDAWNLSHSPAPVNPIGTVVTGGEDTNPVPPVVVATAEERKSFFDTMNLLGWKKYDDVTEADFDSLFSVLMLLPESEQEEYLGQILDYYDAWNLSKSPVPVGSSEPPKVVGEKVTVTAWDRLWASNAGFFYNEVTKRVEIKQGALIRINEGRWDEVTESDFSTAISALSSIQDTDIANRWATWLSNKYSDYLAYINVPEAEEDHTGMVFDPVLNRWKKQYSAGNRNAKYNYDIQFMGPIDTAEQLWSSYKSGNISFDQMMETASLNNINLSAHLDEISQLEQAKEDERFETTIKKTNSIISGLTDITGLLKDGLQAEEVPSLFSSMGNMFGGKFGALLSVIGGVVGLTMGITSLFDDSKVTTSDESVQSQIAQYSGSTIVRINNYFEGSYIIGSGGMQELALTIRDELANLETLAR